MTIDQIFVLRFVAQLASQLWDANQFINPLLGTLFYALALTSPFLKPTALPWCVNWSSTVQMQSLDNSENTISAVSSDSLNCITNFYWGHLTQTSFYRHPYVLVHCPRFLLAACCWRKKRSCLMFGRNRAHIFLISLFCLTGDAFRRLTNRSLEALVNSSCCLCFNAQSRPWSDYC